MRVLPQMYTAEIRLLLFSALDGTYDQPVTFNCQ